VEPVPIEPKTENFMTEIVIVASAFGAQAIRRDGHGAWLASTARSGAAGFEVRRELFADEREASPEALAKLAEALRALGLWSVYSTPAALYDENGALDTAVLGASLKEADALGARFVKLQLGEFRGRADVAAIRQATSGYRARVLVENGQRATDGALDQFVALFDALEREGARDVIGMTFDIGNWQWPGVPPLEAARALAPHVEYIHCKAVVGEGARRFAAAPATDDPLIREVFTLLPRTAPRGIEFPLDEGNVVADAQRRVAWLAAQ
jgi:sugar phosphate isomerase/epimerase